MINIKFYLDSKSDKHFHRPILQIRKKGIHIKVSTKEKVKVKDWDAKKQQVKTSCYEYKSLNSYLGFLKDETSKYLEKSPASKLTDAKIKEKFPI